MLTLGFVGLGMVVLGFLGALVNMFFLSRSITGFPRITGFSAFATRGFGLHILCMAFVFIGMILTVIGFAPSAWQLLLTLIDHAKK